VEIVENRYFEGGIMLLILLSTILLSWDNPLLDPESSLSLAIDRVNTILTWIFAWEMAAKIFALGHRYCRDPWNVMDGTLVMVSLVSLFMSEENRLESVRALRALRALRPLRLINRAPALKRMVNSILLGLPAVLNIVLVLLIIFLIFSIMACSACRQYNVKMYARWKEMEHQISSALSPALTWELAEKNLYTNFPITIRCLGWWEEMEGTIGPGADNYVRPFTEYDCVALNSSWGESIPQSFDNVGHGLLTLFECSTTEGWVDVMFAGIDATSIGQQPVKDWNPWMGWYFVLFMIIGSFFATNLFVGAVIENYQKLSSVEPHAFMTPAQRQWSATQSMIIRTRLKPRRRPPTNPVRRAVYKL
ncbi:unnamed protein product, partial [Discosporangium mesarthrocarpum]